MSQNNEFYFDLEAAKSEIIKDGHPFLPVAEEFLKKYGGLWITSDRKFSTNRTANYVWCHFDALRATQNIDPGWYHSYSKIVGKPLTPIGEAGSNHISLAMADDGYVYGGYDQILQCFGKTGEEAILTLITDKRPPIPAIEWTFD